MANGVIRTKKEAQDGSVGKSDGTVQEIVSDGRGGTTTGSTYSFTDQSIPTVAASTTSNTADVTFDITRDASNNVTATNVRAM